MVEYYKSVYCKDYSKFSFLKGNRRVNQQRVEKLKKSMIANGYLKSQPILVYPDGVIQDGQHRFTAVKELKIPFYIMYVEESKNNDRVQDVQLINTTQTSWSSKDLLDSKAGELGGNYSLLQQYRDKYCSASAKKEGIFINFTSLQVCFGLHGNALREELNRLQNMELNVEQINKRISFAVETSMFIKNDSRMYLSVFFSVMETGIIKEKTLLKAIQRKGIKLPAVKGIKDAVRFSQDILGTKTLPIYDAYQKYLSERQE